MVTNRMQKFDELIMREISMMLRELFPGQIVSVTQVHVSKDLSFAKVWVSARENVEKVVSRCRAHAKEMRAELSQKVVARRVPSLYFVSDLTEEKAEKIDKLLEEVKKQS